MKEETTSQKKLKKKLKKLKKNQGLFYNVSDIFQGKKGANYK